MSDLCRTRRSSRRQLHHLKTHLELQADLADSFRRRARPPIVFTEIGLSGSWGSGGRLDVVTFTSAQSYRKIILPGYEVKASRPDLLSDLRAGKWRKYLPYVTEFYFAFPRGLARADEIPTEAGVIVRGDSGWRKVRPSPKHGSKIDARVYARLLWRMEREARC